MAVRTLSPTFFFLPPWLGLSWRALARTLAYPAADKRDLRLDLLRGFCVFAMIVDHIGGSSWLYGLTGGNRWLVSAAEGFVFLSGLTMGLVYREKLRRFGLRAAAKAALRRAGTLYLLTVALTLIFTALARLTDLALWTDRALASGAPLELVIGALTLHYTYHGADILALYTLLVFASPALFLLLSGGRTVLVMAASWLLWFGFQLLPEALNIPWSIRNAHYFPLAAWQVLFVGGLVLGWHRRTISAAVKQRLALLRNVPLVLSLGSPLLALGSVGWIGRGDLASGGFDPALGLFAKSNLGPGRLVLFLAIFALAYLTLTVAWQPIARAVGWLLLPLGQTTLYGYTMQLFLILPLYNLLAIGNDDPQQIVRNTVGQLATVLLIWTMVRTRFLFRVVPR
jgi:hypothetical protein